MDVVLRRLQAEDIEQVVEIEREAFAPGWVGTPFKKELTNRYSRYLVACLSGADDPAEPAAPSPAATEPGDASLWGRMVRSLRGFLSRDGGAPDTPPEGEVAGYVGVWFQGDEAHIVEIAVRDDLRGKGIGELLLIGSLRAAVAHGSEVMTLEARISNFIAQRLYEKYGFKQMGVRKAYYVDNREDAVIMTTSPIHAPEYQAEFRKLQEFYQQRWRPICILDD